MKKLLLLVPFLFIGCSSIRFVTIEHGRIVTQNNQPVNIVGNPPMICHYEDSQQTFEGYFMYQKDDETIVLDDFGRGTIQLMDNPICQLGFNG
jgi:hypothetical protein